MLASVALSAALVAPAAANERDRAAYRAAVERPGPQWVVASNHFRHKTRCAAAGCVLMGPTDDKSACDEWAKLYNKEDPFDHARCVRADAYLKETR